MEKFNFYYEYKDLCNLLSARQFRKLVIALSEYAKAKTFPDKLSKKTLVVFMKIKNVMDIEWTEYEREKKKESLSQIRSRAGKKGMKHRWG